MAIVDLSEVPESGARSISLEGKRVLLTRDGDRILAIDDTCPHQELSLDGARVRRGSLFCPHHGARFSLEDGRSLSPITDCPLTFYAVTVSGDEVDIAL